VEGGEALWSSGCCLHGLTLCTGCLLLGVHPLPWLRPTGLDNNYNIYLSGWQGVLKFKLISFHFVLGIQKERNHQIKVQGKIKDHLQWELSTCFQTNKNQLRSLAKEKKGEIDNETGS